MSIDILFSILIRILTTIFIILFSVNVYAQEQEEELEELFEMSIEDLMNVEVVTSTKSVSTIEKAPSIITVITADDIRKQGLRSLNDVLLRVPGFFTLPGKPMNKISNRSFSQDHNSNILLLVDGHSMNSINIFGIYNQHLFPTLNKVKRIEIIRGPGSTLWGSDAASGIINIITKGADDLDNESRFGGFEYDYNHDFENNMNASNLLYGNKFGTKGNLFISYTNMRSNAPWNSIYDAMHQKEPVKGNPDTNLDWDQSHELYIKSSYSGLKISGGYLDLNPVHPERTNDAGTNISDAVWKHNWVVLEYDKSLSEKYSLVSKIFYDDYTIETIPRDKTLPNVTQHWTWLDRGYGSEIVLHRNSDKNRVKLGVRYSRRKEGPDEQKRFRNGEVLTSILTAHEGTDINQAVFIEEEYSGLKNTVLTVGGRLDKNNYRDKSTIFIPRASAFYKISSGLSAKYTFNTGHIRPTVRQSRGGDNFFNRVNNRWDIGADKSQRANMNDLQFSFNTKRSLINMTLYHSVIKDNIIFTGVTGRTKTGDNYTLTQINTNDLKSRGVEFDFRLNLFSKFSIYGNYSYSNAEYNSTDLTVSNELIDDVTFDLSDRSFIMKPDLTRTGAPQNLWNTGFTWDIFSWTSLNLHYRGWNTTWVKWNNLEEYKRYGPEHYLDFSLLFNKFITRHFELSLSAFNLLNNDHLLPNISGKGYLETSGARWDIQLRVKL